MIGILIYFYFIIIGYSYSCYIFKEKDLYFRLWMGGILGNVILMAGIVLPSFILGFTFYSHIVLLIFSTLPLLYLVKKTGINKFIELLTYKGNNGCGINLKVFLLAILPIIVLISVLLSNHILAPYKSGGIACGQSTFGDLQMHLGFITSIAEQQKFPPNYAFLDGYTLNYPFFVNMLSSSLYLFGTSLRTSVLIPSYIISALLVIGFYIIAYRLTKRKCVAILASVLFFFGGGFGFSYFFEGAKADNTVFTQIFSEFYRTPTNFTDNNIRWVNPICDMIIPQRTTMAGWCMFFPTLWLLLEALKTKERKYYITLAILASCMPMIHTHTFLALGIISAVMFFAYLVKEEDKKSYIINWCIYGCIIAIIAIPQLLFWTFRQTTGNDAFLKFSFNWVNKQDPYIWFYIKNWGITALFSIPSILKASKENKKLLLACGFIFVISEFILFQPNEYDNNKLFFIVYMILVIFVSDWLLYVWDSLKGIKGRTYLGIVVVICGILSGSLTIIREYKSGALYQVYNENSIKMSEYIKENTPSDAVFLTSTYHINPVVSLAGRNVYVGSSIYVHFHGLGNEYSYRSQEMKDAYRGSYKNLVQFCKQKGIQYVYIGGNERNELEINEELLTNLEEVYSSGSEVLYKVN